MAEPSCAGCRERDRRIAVLEAQVVKLSRMVEELSRAVKRQTAPFSKGPPKADPKPPGRKPGEAYGEHTRREPPEQVDETHRAELPERSDCCHAPIEKTGETSQHQTDVEIRCVHRRFDIEHGECTSCGRRLQGRHPLQTSDAVGAASVQLGPQAKALMVHLNKEVGASYGKVQRFFQAAFGIEISRATGCRSVLAVARRAETAYRQICRTVRRSRRGAADETGWKVGGDLWWQWVFVMRRAVLYRIVHSRGGDVLEDVLGLDWSGEISHDGWKPYDQLTRATHLQCAGHILVRCKRLLSTAQRGAARFPLAVKKIFKQAIATRDRRDAGEITLHGARIAAGRCFHRLSRLVDGNFTHNENRKLANHLHRHLSEWFLFLMELGRDATNWRAEQAIRPAVVNRKVWGGNRTPVGAHAQEVLVSVVQTCKTRGVDEIAFLRSLLCSPKPLLIPAGVR